MKCPMCDQGELHRETRSVEYKYQGRVITVEQHGDFCDRCGEAVLGPGDLASNRQALLDLLSVSEDSGEISLEEAFDAAEGGKAWARKHAAAIRAYNEFVERHGMFVDDRLFYKPGKKDG